MENGKSQTFYEILVFLSRHNISFNVYKYCRQYSLEELEKNEKRIHRKHMLKYL